MFRNKKIVDDERVKATKQKISSEAFGIMFFTLLAITFVKGVILEIPSKEYITETLLFIGISFYVCIRMIMCGVYASNIQNLKRKTQILTSIVSTIIFMAATSIYQFIKFEVHLIIILCMGIVFFISSYGILLLVNKLTEKRELQLLEPDEE